MKMFVLFIFAILAEHLGKTVDIAKKCPVRIQLSTCYQSSQAYFICEFIADNCCWHLAATIANSLITSTKKIIYDDKISYDSQIKHD